MIGVFKIDIERRKDESPIDYHKRIVYGKLVDKTLSEYDYTELGEIIYGQEYASDVARRMMYGSRKTLELIDEYNANSECCCKEPLSTSIDDKILELKKERQKMFDERVSLNKVIRAAARKEELREIINKSITSFNPSACEFRRDDIEDSDCDMLVSLNDIHYGASVNNYWRTYNTGICVNMFNEYLNRIIKIQDTHKCKNCIVWGNGDFISGNIHYSIAVSNMEDVINQTKHVSEIIADFLFELSKYFDTVTFVSVAGNHSRMNTDKDNSLVSERLDDFVSWYLQARLRNVENIIIEEDRIDSTLYEMNIRGKKYCGVHGDFDGSPQKITALNNMCGGDIYAVLSGHMHHNKIENVGGVKSIMAGGFLGMDDYCVKNRIFGNPEQIVCICNDYGISCYYDIQFTNGIKKHEGCECYGS